MLVDEFDPSDIYCNDGFLQGMKNTLHLSDHGVLFSPEFDNLLLAEMQKVMEECQKDDHVETQGTHGAKSFLLNQNSIEISLLVVDHSISTYR